MYMTTPYPILTMSRINSDTVVLVAPIKVANVIKKEATKVKMIYQVQGIHGWPSEL
jgi:hypothetical protein